MVIDPAMVLATIPADRQVHFWAKNELFSNKLAAKILVSGGAVSVDRKNRDNRLLFKATFETLERDGLVAVFPEGVLLIFFQDKVRMVIKKNSDSCFFWKRNVGYTTSPIAVEG